MNLETAGKIYDSIRASSHTELADDLIDAAIRYARIRTDWTLVAPEERRERDRQRTIAHDALIDSCNILSRNMAKAGEDFSWRSQLGDDRKVIGDFACCLHCILGLQAR